MSLRQEILKEIKSLLNEAEGADQRFDAIRAKFSSKNVDQVRKTTTPAEAKEFLAAVKDVVAQRTYAAASTGITGGYKSNATGAQKLSVICKLGNVGGQYDFLMTRDKQKVQWCNEQAEVSPTPKPKPQTCPDGSPAPGGDVSKCPKKEMARSGLCKPPYVGKNGGVSQGPAVQQVQEILANPKIGLLKNAQFTPGQVDTATNNAIFSLQEKLAPLGSKIASGLGGTYEGQAIKPDGCYGPKTSCAVSLYYGLPDVYNKGKKRCLRILGIKMKDVAKASGAIGFPASQGMVDLKESKSWADRTRESTASNLFERLVKDASKKKVI